MPEIEPALDNRLQQVQMVTRAARAVKWPRGGRRAPRFHLYAKADGSHDDHKGFGCGWEKRLLR